MEMRCHLKVLEDTMRLYGKSEKHTFKSTCLGGIILWINGCCLKLHQLIPPKTPIIKYILRYATRKYC